MNRKFLEDLLNGVITEDSARKDAIDKIMAKNGEQIESHKTEIATLKNDLKVKDGVIDNLNAKIQENDKIDVEAIKQEQFNLGKAEGSKEVETFKKGLALDKALSDTKARDTKLLSKLLDNDKLGYEEKDGNYVISGLDEQINAIKESHSYLFDGDSQEKTVDLGMDHNTGAQNDNSFERKVMGLE